MALEETATTPILEVRDLHVTFKGSAHPVYAVNGVDFSVRAGQWVGVVGESGSGKSATLSAILGLLGQAAAVEGGVRFQGRELLGQTERQWAQVRGRDISMVFQGLSTALNPYMRVGEQIMEPLLLHRLTTPADARARALALLSELGVPDAAARFRSYPSQWSGGMRQRAALASALATEPAVLLADEPTTAVDATVQAQVLKVLETACRSRGMAVVLVTHDLGIAMHLCDRILVMYGGRVMETAPVARFITAPAHPYTRALQAALIDTRDPWRPLTPIAGTAASLTEPLSGCPFAPRCTWAVDQCQTSMPPLTVLGSDHTVACHRVEEVVAHG